MEDCVSSDRMEESRENSRRQKLHDKNHILYPGEITRDNMEKESLELVPSSEAGLENDKTENDDFDTRSEATSDTFSSEESAEDTGNDLDIKEVEFDFERQSNHSSRGISPIVYSADSLSDDDIRPPGESFATEPKKTIIIPPAEIRTQRRDRHSKMLKYLFRDARFFLIKSNNHENVSLSKAKGVWSTPPSNEAKLNKAFRESRNVILLFSVRESGAFQGFARVSTESRHDLNPVHWVLPPGLSARALGGVFKIDWLCRRELSFIKTMDIRNPFNENKPVKIGRDGQEVEPNAGKILCLEFPYDDGIDLEGTIHKVRKKEKEFGASKYETPHYPILASHNKNKTRRNRGPDKDRSRYGTGRAYLSSSSQVQWQPRSYTKASRYMPRSSIVRREEAHSNVAAITKHHGAPHTNAQKLFYRPLGAGYQSSLSTFSSVIPQCGRNHKASVRPYSVTTAPKSESKQKSPRMGSQVNCKSSFAGQTKGYDSRAHAAACDDFVRRVASGRNAGFAVYGDASRVNFLHGHSKRRLSDHGRVSRSGHERRCYRR